MNLLDVYNLLSQGEITDEQAANTFGFTVENFRYRVAKWKHRLPLMLATLDKIATDAISREEAAETLEVTERQVNKLMESWKVVRPLKTYLVVRASTQIKWEIHMKFAIEVISGSAEFPDAAEGAGISIRQMRRWVSNLLKKHYEMPYKDLLGLSLTRRRRLADEIERAEHLELSKMQVLKSIADGKLSREEEALNRVLSKRSNQSKRTLNVTI